MSKLNNIPLTWRMSVFILLGAGLILLGIVGYTYIEARKLLIDELEGKAGYLAAKTAGHIETIQKAVEKVAIELGVVLDNINVPENTIYNFLENTVASHDEIYGSAIAFNPSDKKRGHKSPYVYREGDKFISKDLGQGNYVYEVQDWFVVPRALNRPVWSEPYYDEGGGEALMVTYSVPFYKNSQTREFQGIVTADLSLDWLTEFLESIPLQTSSYAFVISRHGTFISHPNKSFIMNETFFSIAETMKDQDLRKIGQQMVAGKSEFIPYTSLATDKDGWLVYVPVPSTDWSLGMVFPSEEIMSKVWKLNRIVLLISSLGLILLGFVVIVIAQSITNPIAKLEEATKVLAEGKLDIPLPKIKGKDEIAGLANSFEKMRSDLQVYIKEVVEKKRMEQQLAIAHEIQEGFLPRELPETPGLEVAGRCFFCLEIAGDYYDVIPLTDNRTLFAIGDVSGKGAGAALLMANLQASLRIYTKAADHLDEAVFEINNLIDHNTPKGDFITFFTTFFNPQTNKLTYVNAGHNPPVILRSNGDVEELKRTGVFLGAFADMEYEMKEIDFNKNDILLMYTDGASEAENENEEEFQAKRIIDYLKLNSKLPVEKIVDGLHDEVIRFQKHENFADDLTIVCVRTK